MIRPTSFAIHVTYTCPLTCAHCCFKSSPKVKDRLDANMVLATINELDTNTIKLIAFTGGEPFLLGKSLVEFIELAHSRGFRTRVVTSGYFGITPYAAKTRLQELVEVGLNELSISWDDYHEKFVSFETIRNVAKEATKFKHLLLAINIARDKKSKWTADRVGRELDVDSSCVVVESFVNLTGRADEELREVEFVEQKEIGPCPYVITGPTLSAKKKLLACCGVIPDTERLHIQDNFDPSHVNEAMEKARKSPLFNWLFLRGPYAIMEWISSRYGVAIPEISMVGGNCQACKHLFEIKEIESLLDKAIAEKTPEIMGEIYLLESLGLLQPNIIWDLWHGHKSSHIALPVAPANE